MTRDKFSKIMAEIINVSNGPTFELVNRERDRDNPKNLTTYPNKWL